MDLDPDPNPVRLRRERLPKPQLDTYRSKRRSFYMFQAAARLWAEGVSWPKALEIITEAFDATTHEA
ncbi:unnamed protein product [Durusdinium trenchii]|uniref:Uncharacterized protein n=1 Tax=Durusdinium trenchii TaxID=1381693 RepID=A0ABP0P5X3_9DINO